MLKQSAALDGADVGAQHVSRLVSKPSTLGLGARLARATIQESRLGWHKSHAAIGAAAPVPRVVLQRGRHLLQDAG